MIRAILQFLSSALQFLGIATLIFVVYSFNSKEDAYIAGYEFGLALGHAIMLVLKIVFYIGLVTVYIGLITAIIFLVVMVIKFFLSYFEKLLSMIEKI